MNKRILTLLIICSLVQAAKSQTLTPRSDASTTQLDERLAAEKNLYVPFGTSPSLNGGLERNGALYYNTSNGLLYTYGASNLWEYLLNERKADSLYVSLAGAYNNPSWINSLDVSKVATPSSMSGSVIFSNGTALSQDNLFYWDNTNKRLGIGTSTPNAALEIRNGSTGTDVLRFYSAAKGASGGTNIGIGNYLNGVANTSGDRLGQIMFQGVTSSVQAEANASISAFADGSFTATSSPASLRFATTPINSVSIAERMRITSEGEVLIGKTNDDGNYKLQVSGGVYSNGALL